VPMLEIIFKLGAEFNIFELPGNPIPIIPSATFKFSKNNLFFLGLISLKKTKSKYVFNNFILFSLNGCFCPTPRKGIFQNNQIIMRLIHSDIKDYSPYS